MLYQKIGLLYTRYMHVLLMLSSIAYVHYQNYTRRPVHISVAFHRLSSDVSSMFNINVKHVYETNIHALYIAVKLLSGHCRHRTCLRSTSVDKEDVWVTTLDEKKSSNKLEANLIPRCRSYYMYMYVDTQFGQGRSNRSHLNAIPR